MNRSSIEAPTGYEIYESNLEIPFEHDITVTVATEQCLPKSVNAEGSVLIPSRSYGVESKWGKLEPLCTSFLS